MEKLKKTKKFLINFATVKEEENIILSSFESIKLTKLTLIF